MLIVVPSVTDGGATRANLDLAAGLRRLGVAVEQFSIRPPDEQVAHGETDAPVTSGLPPGRRLRYGYPLMVRRLIRAARASTVVVSGWEVGDGLVAAYVAGRLAQRPVVGEVAADPIGSLGSIIEYRWAPWVTVPMAGWIYPRLEAAVCASEGLRPRVAQMGVEDCRVQTIRPGIDVDNVRAMAREPGPDWLPDGDYVLGLGRLARQKGFDVLIEAHARLRAQGHDQRLVLVGEGPDREALEELARQRGVADSVLMPGFLDNPFPVLARASLFCLSSRYEGYGLVVAEALTLGVPIVATDCVAGPAEILAGGRYGALVEPESTAGLAEAIGAHRRDPEPLRDAARAGAEDTAHVSIEATAQRYLELFGRLEASA